ncbi:MAG: hypothetical protein R3200_17260, partial [Xanthomonadales bacterium]|nr:hypothetical protein [Xanthomonadales bacterium]
VSRQGWAILSELGLQELCAVTSRDYVETAVRLGKDASRRAAIRKSLRRRIADHNARHGASLAAGLEALYAECLSAS